MKRLKKIVERHGKGLAEDDENGLQVRKEVYPPLTDVLQLNVPGSEGGELVGQSLEGLYRARDFGLGRRRPGILDLPPVAVFVLCTVVAATAVNGYSCWRLTMGWSDEKASWCSVPVAKAKLGSANVAWDVLVQSALLDALLVAVVLGLVFSVFFDWIERHGLPFDIALWLSGDRFRGERCKVKKELRLQKGRLTLSLAEDEVPHGMGVYRFAEGHAVRGEWHKGHLHGEGNFVHNDGDEYVGEFRQGLPGGWGTYRWADGTIYEGEFARGLPHGRGMKSWCDGDVYEGGWSKGKPHGSGVYVWASGRRYDGEWKDGKMEGQGACEFVNGDRYEGGWKADKKFGYGVYSWVNGTCHAGEWG